MKVLDIYDFDENNEPRYKRTDFYVGGDEYLGISHGFSYLNARNLFKSSGKKMGLDKLVDCDDN